MQKMYININIYIYTYLRIGHIYIYIYSIIYFFLIEGLYESSVVLGLAELRGWEHLSSKRVSQQSMFVW